MNTLNEHRDLIERLVKSNSKFKGNEDLIEDFCSETYKRSYALLETAGVEHLENYIAKVVNTAILHVLKDSGRIHRRANRYVSSKEILIDPVAAVNKEEYKQSPVIAASSFVYDISDPKDSFEEKIVRKDILQKIVDIILVAQKNDPTQEFLRIFYLRYIKEYKQKEIAEEINISQSEVSKRLVALTKIVKNHFGM